MNKVSRQFYNKIHRLFPLLGNEEKQFLNKFKEHLEIYETKYPSQTYDDYLEYFGNPKDIISTYYEHIESEYIVTHMKSRKIIKYLSITFICVFIAVSIALVFFRYKEYQLSKENQYFYTEVIEEVAEEEITQ
ncbi:MAG: DUF6120 family protein [Coprobacillus sp.]